MVVGLCGGGCVDAVHVAMDAQWTLNGRPMDASMDAQWTLGFHCILAASVERTHVST